MFTQEPPAIALGERASLSLIALDEALSAPEPHPRSPAFAIQAIYRLVRDDEPSQTREGFLRAFRCTSPDVYKGKLSWNYGESCWELGPGPTVDCSRIEEDALRWYVTGRDFSRHTRDSKFAYPEDAVVLSWQDDGDKIYNALMPLPGELTRRLFQDPKTNDLGYCDVYRSNEPGQFTAVLGFFDDPRTHGVRVKSGRFWELEGAVIPSMLRLHRVLRYDVLPLSAKRGA
jgi:hypothetical protein